MDVSQYLEIFLDETKEHLQNLNNQILELESDAENMNTINEIFRAAHSLKGMAGTMGYKRMQTLTHDMENVFSEVRNGNIKVNADMIDVLFSCLDALEEYTGNIQQSADEGTNDNEELIAKLNAILKAGTGKAEEPAPKKEKKKKAAAVEAEGKWKDISFEASQLKVMREAKKSGLNVYGMTVVVQESCLLKAARAFLVFKAIEEKGEIVVSVPSAQDVEDEKFDRDFTLVVISEHDLDTVIKAAQNVSEIEKVTGAVIEIPEEDTKPSQDVKKVEEPAEKKAGAQATPEKKTVSKPVVNRTVRVDIEELDGLMN